MASCPTHAMNAEQHCEEIERMLEQIPEYMLEGDGDSPSDAVRRLAEAYRDLRAAYSAVGTALDHVESVVQDDEVDLSDVDSPEKAKEAQLELIAHLRDQLEPNDAPAAPIDLALEMRQCLTDTGLLSRAEPTSEDIDAAAEELAKVAHARIVAARVALRAGDTKSTGEAP